VAIFVANADSPTETIYVFLLDEGTEVWRPIQARHLGDDRFQITSINDDPDDEHWQFSTGDIVRCSRRRLSDGIRLVAYERVEQSA